MIATTKSSEYFNRDTVLTPEAIACCPPAVATAPAPSRSHRYTFVPTDRVVEGLCEAGWSPVGTQQRHARTPEGVTYGKHLVRLRWAAHVANLAEYVVELLLTNAHDGSASYCLTAGIYRRICSNGLVIGDSTFDAIRFPHRGSSTDKIVEGSLRLVQEIPAIAGRVDAFKARKLSWDEECEFAHRARDIRYPDVDRAPVAADSLLAARRHEDAGHDLWSTYNRVQENLVRGGFSDGFSRTPSGRVRIVRPIRGIDSSLRVNKGLWNLATSYLN